jgi:hypothetical protein
MAEPRYLICYDVADRLIAEAFDLDSMPLIWSAKLGEPIHPPRFDFDFTVKLSD